MIKEELKISGIVYNGDDALQKLNEILVKYEQLFNYGYQSFRFERLLLVLDSSILLADIRYYLKNGHPTSLQLCLKHNIAYIVSPKTLEMELYKHIPRLSKRSRNTKDLWIEKWESIYKPYINFVDIVPDDTAGLLSVLRDPNDATFIDLYQQSNADGVLSKDKHINELKVSPEKSLEFILDLRKYAELKSVELQFAIGGVLIATVTMAMFEAALKAIIALLKKFPILQGIGIGYVFYLLFSLKGRAQFQSVKGKIGKAISIILSSKEVEHIATSFTQSAKAKNNILKSLPPKKELKTLKDYAQRVFYETKKSLTIHEVQARMRSMGYDKQSLSSSAYIKKIVKSLPHIEQIGKDRWKYKITE